MSSVAHYLQSDLLLSSTTTDIPTAGVTATTGSQLHTSVFDQNRRLTHTHIRARALKHTQRNFESTLAPSFSSKLISFRQIAKVASPLFNLHACQCLRMFIFISFMCLFRRVCFEIRRDLEKEGEDAGRGVVAGRMGGCVMVTNTCDKRHGTPVPLCK